MLYTVFVPEYLMGKALGERFAARYGVELMSYKRGHGLEWEEIHSYMANMGYFVLDFGDLLEARERARQQEQALLEASNPTDKQPIIYHYAESTEYPFENEVNLWLQHKNPKRVPVIQGYPRINLLRLRHRYWALTTTQLYHAAVDNIDIPNIAARKLKNLDRGEVFTKMLALLQTVYLILQLVVRRVTKLPSAQIEIAALAFSAAS